MCTPTFMLPLIIQLSLTHTVTITVIVEDRRFKPCMSHQETIGGTNQLSYKAFGQLQIIYTLELGNTLVPKSFSPTSISLYPTIYNWLLPDFCILWKNTFVDWILETKDFVKLGCTLSLKAIHSLCNDNKHILLERKIFYES